MDLLCQTVRSEMTKAFEGNAITDWQFQSTYPNSCTVCCEKLIIKFTLDQRDKLISSSITFLDAEKKHQEELYSHVLAKMFRDLICNFERNTATLESSVATEVANIISILKHIEKEKLLPRDLFYFYSGYSCGYTESVSAEG